MSSSTLQMERIHSHTPRPADRWRNRDEIRWAARHWASRMGVELRTIHIRPMAKKWASISTAGRLTIDSELVDLPKELGEFVLVHELVHLLCPASGHGRLFRAFLSAYLPDWREREESLQLTGGRVPSTKAKNAKKPVGS